MRIILKIIAAPFVLALMLIGRRGIRSCRNVCAGAFYVPV